MPVSRHERVELVEEEEPQALIALGGRQVGTVSAGA